MGETNPPADMNEYLQYLQKIPRIERDIIDLHIHTTISDGTLTPQQVIDFSLQRGLKIIAITDHDTIDGLWEIQKYVQDKPITVVNGIEFSCEETEKGFDEIHVIGLFVDPKNKSLYDRTELLLQKRIERGHLIIQKLQSLGFDINITEVEQRVGSAFGRPHISKILMEKYPKQFQCVQDVFDALIGNGKTAYVPRLDKIKVKEAVEIIKQAGGLSVLAHPGLYNDADIHELIEYFAGCGGQAVEGYYPYDVNTKENKIGPNEAESKNILIRNLAEKYNLLLSGGSDFHGAIRPILIGDCGISPTLFEKLKLNKK